MKYKKWILNQTQLYEYEMKCKCVMYLISFKQTVLYMLYAEKLFSAYNMYYTILFVII